MELANDADSLSAGDAAELLTYFRSPFEGGDLPSLNVTTPNLLNRKKYHEVRHGGKDSRNFWGEVSLVQQIE